MADKQGESGVNLEKLTKPFDRASIKSRTLPGGGSKRAEYVEGHTVIHRLNDATGNNWSFLVDDMHSQPAPATSGGLAQMLWICRGTLTIPGLGTRAGVGVQMVNEKSEDLVKGALTDCLKACAKNFGVALELYGPDYEDDGEQVDRRTGEITQAPRQAAPAHEPTAPETPRDTAARTLWNEAKALGLTVGMLDAYCIQQTNHTLKKADLQAILKVRNALKAVKDIEQLKDVLSNQPTAAAEDPIVVPDQQFATVPESDAPCAIDGCAGVCTASFVAFSVRRYGVPLCAKHSALAKRGELDTQLASLNA